MWGLTTERSTGRLLPELSGVRGIVVATKLPGSDEPIDLTTSLLQLTPALFPMANHSPLFRLLGRFPRSRCRLHKAASLAGFAACLLQEPRGPAPLRELACLALSIASKPHSSGLPLRPRDHDGLAERTRRLPASGSGHGPLALTHPSCRDSVQKRAIPVVNTLVFLLVLKIGGDDDPPGNEFRISGLSC